MAIAGDVTSLLCFSHLYFCRTSTTGNIIWCLNDQQFTTITSSIVKETIEWSKMMNKKVVGTLVVAMTAGAAFLPLTAQATGVSETGAGIGFSSGPNTTIPGPYEDQLSLVNRPTSFQFGESNTPSKTTKAYTQAPTGKQYIAAFEDRSDADRTAWNLKAQLSNLVSGEVDESGKEKALSATLSFNTASISTFTIDKDTETGLYPIKIPVLPPLTDIGAGAAVTGVQKVNLVAGGDSAIIMKATKDAVKGGYAAEVKNVQLLVNGVQATETNGKSFSGQVTWSLENVI